MKVKYIPIYTFERNKIHYSFKDQMLIVKYRGKRDVFDFSGLSNGATKANMIESRLDIQPINFVMKENGILFVELLKIITLGEEAEENTEWTEV